MKSLFGVRRFKVQAWKVTLLVAAFVISMAALQSVAFAAPPVPSIPGGGGGGPIIFIDPDDPTLKPVAPTLFGVDTQGEDALTTSSIRLRWRDRSSYEQGNHLQRRLPGGSWQMVANLGAKSGANNFYTYQDNGLNSDTQFCYRVRAFNTHGSSYSPQKCITTLDGRTIWRAQIEFRTADVSDAGTDDSVNVSLNVGNGTWLDYGRDDFERDDVFAYDLDLGSLGDLSKVDRIHISKTGSNGWCMEGFALLINGEEIYSETFGSSSTTCHWLDNDNGHVREYTVSRSSLRAHSSWVNFDQPNPPLTISDEEIESRIESIIGDFAHGEDVYWGHLHGSEYVEVSKVDNQTVHIDVDMSADAPLLPDPEVDIDFDLEFTVTCENGDIQLDVSTKNVEVEADSNWFWETVSILLIEFLDNHVENRVSEEFPNITKTLVEAQLPNGISCVDILVNPNGTVIFVPVFDDSDDDDTTTTFPTNPPIKLNPTNTLKNVNTVNVAPVTRFGGLNTSKATSSFRMMRIRR